MLSPNIFADRCGYAAEVFVRVNSASFRAIGEVKALRGNSGVGLEFVQLSAGGNDMLADVVTDLARLQAIMNKLKGARREMDAEAFQEELERGRLQTMLLGDRFPFLRTTVGAESLPGSSKESSDSNTEGNTGSESAAEQESLVLRVDLFG
jgi:hypothetical protein